MNSIIHYVPNKSTTSQADKFMEQTEWLNRRDNHVRRLAPVVNAHQQRTVKAQKNPIIDFLFEYYHFKPGKLLNWSPGLGVILQGSAAMDLLSNKHYGNNESGVFIDPLSFPEKRLIGLDWVINLLTSTYGRKPAFGCFGLHEWCMIYEQTDIRHTRLPLRISHAQIRNVVESSAIKCTHYDAYRFYSPSARKFNHLPLTRSDMIKHEQPGCLHSNMDLYRWAYKFYPWLSSDLIADTFLLALDIRETDMRASPYDVSQYTSLAPIKIESRQGKEEYASLQRAYAGHAQQLRGKLIEELEALKMQFLLKSKTI